MRPGNGGLVLLVLVAGMTRTLEEKATLTLSIITEELEKLIFELNNGLFDESVVPKLRHQIWYIEQIIQSRLKKE